MSSVKERILKLISVCFSGGQENRGVEFAPLDILDQGLIGKLKDLGWLVEKEEKLLNKILPGEYKHIDGLYDDLSDLRKTIRSIDQNQTVLTLGGDHSISLGTVRGPQGAMEDDFSFLWIDSHADIMIPKDSSNCFHRMYLFCLIKEVREKYPFLTRIKPVIHAKDFFYIGLRDISEKEKKILKEFDITYFSISSIDKLGIYKITKEILNKIRHPLHVSFDVGVLDPSFIAPFANVPTSGGGLSLREILFIGEEIAKANVLKKLDIVELNPIKGDKHRLKLVIENIIEIILSFLGKQRL